MEYLNRISELELCSTTPQKALQLLSSCPSPEAFDIESEEPCTIFRSFFLFIVGRRPDASVNGIWEELLWNTIKYSENPRHYLFGLGHQVKDWLERALSSSGNCPNPYIRLELFRLVRIFELRTVVRRLLCDTFICTISQIPPQHLYHGDNVDNVLFGIQDMFYILRECEDTNILKMSLYNGLTINIRFLLHCVHFTGVLAATAVSKPNSNIENCFDVLYIMMRAVDMNSLEWFKSSVVEVLRDITTAILGLQHSGLNIGEVMFTRDHTVSPLHSISKTNALPRLLLDRQIHPSGVRPVQRHALLFRELSRVYHKNMSFADEDSDAERKYEDKFSSYIDLDDTISNGQTSEDE